MTSPLDLERLPDYYFKVKIKLLMYKHGITSFTPFEEDLIEAVIDMTQSWEDKIDEIREINAHVDNHKDEISDMYDDIMGAVGDASEVKESLDLARGEIDHILEFKADLKTILGIG